MFVWQENNLGFSSDFAKKHYKNNDIKQPHTTQIKIHHDKGSISGPRGKDTQLFYGTTKIVNEYDQEIPQPQTAD